MEEWRYNSTILDLGISVSRPGRFTPKVIAPGAQWIGGWVGPRAGLDVVEKTKILPLPEFELRPSSP
jgi:hypothetical protein